jgi:hypothetical protein
MRLRIIAMAIGLSLALSAARANDILAITETGENFNDLVATFNGAPLSITLTGPADGWTIELPAGFSVGISGQAFVAEPENSALYNAISFTQPTFMIWESELVPQPGFTLPTSNTVTLPGAGTGPFEMPFDLVLTDGPRSVPDGGATAMLFTAALTGLGLARRFARP